MDVGGYFNDFKGGFLEVLFDDEEGRVVGLLGKVVQPDSFSPAVFPQVIPRRFPGYPVHAFQESAVPRLEIFFL